MDYVDLAFDAIIQLRNLVVDITKLIDGVVPIVVQYVELVTGM